MERTSRRNGSSEGPLIGDDAEQYFHDEDDAVDTDLMLGLQQTSPAKPNVAWTRSLSACLNHKRLLVPVAVTVIAVLALLAAVWEPLQSLMLSPYNTAMTIHGESTIFRTRNTYVSYTIDTSRDRAFFDTDLTDPKLKYLARQLAPSIVRVGGTGNNYLVYQLGKESDCQRGIERSDNNFTRECLNMTWWDNLNHLIREADGQLVFGLNLDYPNFRAHDQLPIVKWDSANTRDLLEYSIRAGYDIYGLELGNELSSAITGQAHADFFRELADLLAELYPDESKRPKLFGPDPHSYAIKEGSWAGRGGKYFRDFVRNTSHTVTGYTYHEYVGVDSEASALDPAVLNLSRENGLRILKAVESYGHAGQEVWVGESANRNLGGGGFGGSFGSAMWFADALGIKAAIRHSVFCRQDLFGASYGLLQVGSLDPNPGYWVALIAKRLLGTGVLNVSAQADPLVRSYAFCAKTGTRTGSVTALFVNLHRDSRRTNVDVDIAGTDGRYSHRREYHLTTDNISGSRIRLNDQELLLNADGQVPPLAGNLVSGGATDSGSAIVTLKPQSITFVVFRDAMAKACLRHG